MERERDRMRRRHTVLERELLSTAIFPRILSPREYSLLASIYLAATSTGSTNRAPISPESAAVFIARRCYGKRKRRSLVLSYVR